MILNKNILAILAIFCVLLSACAVSATDQVDQMTDDDGMYLSPHEDGHNGAIIPPDNTHDEQRHAAGGDYYLDGSQDGHNGTIIPPDANHNEAAMANATNSTAHAAGEPVQNATNHTASASTAAHKLPATGNPILALFAVSAVLGGASVLRRKK